MYLSIFNICIYRDSMRYFEEQHKLKINLIQVHFLFENLSNPWYRSINTQNQYRIEAY